VANVEVTGPEPATADRARRPSTPNVDDLDELGCRACGAGGLELVLDLGTTPLANSLPAAGQLDEPEERFPLALAFCGACGLVQITHSVAPEKLFREYLYFSSFSDTMVGHARVLATRLTAERSLSTSSRVIELASNDGYLLQFYRAAGIPVLGIEPAVNIARVAERERGIPTLCEFFGAGLAARLRAEGQTADVLHANNVLAHVPDLNGFVAGIAAILAPGGVAVVEVPYVGDMVDGLEFDTIYHEHLCYFSVSALDALFARHGLSIHDVERLAIHGGSIRIFASPVAAAVAPAPAKIALLADEQRRGLTSVAYYRTFGRRIEELGGALVALLRGLKAAGKRIAAYGAAAKGSTLLNTFHIDGTILDFVVDRSTHKQGRFMPGVRLPIHPTERLLEAIPDYVLLLTWNFADEILAQQAAYRAQGGRFIIALPAPKIV